MAADNNDKVAILRGGKLSIIGDIGEPKLLFNGKKILEPETFGLDIIKTFPVGETDVVLIMNNSGGTACPVQYFFVSITLQGVAELSPEFGTCSDLAKPIQNGSKITITMPKIGERGSATYTYYNGSLTETGKPIKSAGLVSNEGKISTVENMVTVPKVDGICLWSTPTPDKLIKSAGLKPKNIQIHGPEEGAGETGCAYRQSPKAGTTVKKGSIVKYRMWFEAG
jgi:hypothetical protein